MSYMSVLDELEGIGVYRFDAQAYMDLIGPGETPEMQRDMKKMSTCALFVSGVWQRAGLQDPLLSPPYQIGSAVTRLVLVAMRRRWLLTLFPSPSGMHRGDVLIVEKPEHCMIVLKAPRTGSTISVIEGGSGMRCTMRRASATHIGQRRIIYVIRPAIGDGP